MKCAAAYGVDPNAVFSALKNAGQPVVEVRYRGPTRSNVALLCVCLDDSADLTAAQPVINGLSGQKPTWDGVDAHIQALFQGVGQKLVSYKG